MKNIVRYLCIGCVSISLLLPVLALKAEADEGGAVVGVKKTIRLGRIRLEPQVKLGAAYNDNIYLESTDEQDDVIIAFVPGFHAKYLGAPGNYLTAGYDLNLSFYMDHNNNNYQTHAPYINFGIKSPFGFYLKAEDIYTNTADSYGAENRYGEGRKVRRWDNSFGLTLGYEFARRFGLEGTYNNYIIKYSGSLDNWQDRMDHQLGTAFFYRVAAKTLVLFQVRTTLAEYTKQNDGIDVNLDGIIEPHYDWCSSNSQDYKLYDYFVGVRFEPGQRAMGEIKLGYGQKKFDNDVSRGGIKYSDQSSWVAETDFSYHFLRNTKLAVLFKRSHVGSPDSFSSSYINTTFGGRLNQGIGQRLSLNLGVEYTYMDYADRELSDTSIAAEPVPSRSYNLYSLSTGLDWRIMQWLNTGIVLGYTKKTAGNDFYKTDEYENMKIGFSANASF